MSLPVRIIVGSALTALLPWSAHAAWGDLNMRPGVTPISQTAYDLHMLVIWICVAIGVVVFGAMFYSIVRHRKAVGAEPGKFHHSTKAEILWTVVPCVILVALAIPATKGLVAMEDTSEPDMSIKVTGYQWKWRYEYLEHGIDFYSNLAPASRAAIHGDPTSVDHYLLDVDNPVVIPVGKKVRLLITADDVIHAWWIPAFGMKKDAIPGFVNAMWIRADRPGVYRGQCAELCGKDHGFMPVVAVVKPQAEFEQWIADQKKAQAASPNRPPAGKSLALAQPAN